MAAERSLQAMVDAADVAALLLAVDGLCAARDWDALADLARRCRDAVELGKQLWPVAMHVDYRLALEGPPSHAGAVLRPGAGRFAHGPLTEVAAATHDFASLAPHIPSAASAASVAQERVLRGEDLRGVDVWAELPRARAAWEPVYALPVYRDRSATFPQPDVALRSSTGAGPLRPRSRPGGRPGDGPRERTADPLPDDPAAAALAQTVETWAAQSNGRVRAVAVEGDEVAAVGALVPSGRLLAITPSEALSLLQWAGASGGAYGRRRGGAAGRFAAWWAAAALAGLEWPDDRADPDDLDGFSIDLGRAVHELTWFRWWDDLVETGWVLRIAVTDPADGLAWAVDATDHRHDGDAA